MLDRKGHLKYFWDVKFNWRLTAQALLLLSAFSLLLSTVGVSVHAVYCYCSGVRQWYLFAPESGQGSICAIKVAEKSGCCASRKNASPNNCCSSKSNSCQIAAEKGCMKNSTEVVLLQTDLGKEDVPTWSALGKWDKGNVFVLLPEWPPATFLLPASGYLYYAPLWPHPPPLPSGQFKRILYQSFLC